MVLADTRHLSPRGQALYAGAKMAKYGIEISMHDKRAAMEKLFKHLHLHAKDNQQKTDPHALVPTCAAVGHLGHREHRRGH